MTLRSSLNPEEQTNLVEGPTTHRQGPNQSKLICSFCNEIYYVDEETFEHAISAMEEGLENPFCCDDCDVENGDTSH